MHKKDDLIGPHGGYRKLKTFQLGQLIYDLTVRFCDRYINRRSRTHDQMVQAARSGVQNIAEGSQASGTSKKMELKLTNVARASLEELRLDYEDYLRQRELPKLPPSHPVLMRFKAKRCATLDEVRVWVEEERQLQKREKSAALSASAPTTTDKHSQANLTQASVQVSRRPWHTLPTPALVANAALSLLNVCCYLLDRQLSAQAAKFEKEGGFTERLYKHRQNSRRGK